MSDSDSIHVEGICARNSEIKQLRDFIYEKINNKKPGIVFMPGGPGTGKSMCVKYVMDEIKDVPKLYLNCAKVLKSNEVLKSICDEYNLGKVTRRRELVMTDELMKYFTAPNTEPHLMVLDEVDELPKSKAQDLLKKILFWAEEKDSKLILIAIANTTDLTSRRDIINSILGRDCTHITRIIFRPYTTEDLKMILQWYVDNDPYFHDHEVEKNSINLLARQYSRLKGDVRGAVNALKSCYDDVMIEEQEREKEKENEKESSPEPVGDVSIYPPTPPSTPTPKTPITRRQTRTTCASVTKSTSKRTAKTLRNEMPYVQQVILTCIKQLCSKSRQDNISIGDCIHLAHPVLEKSGLKSSHTEIRDIIENLCSQSLIQLKKGPTQKKISFRISDAEFSDIVLQKVQIVSLIKALPKS